MLPLVVAAAQHQGILHPDTHPGQMQAGIDECPTEVQPLRIRMKNISRPSRPVVRSRSSVGNDIPSRAAASFRVKSVIGIPPCNSPEVML